MTTMLRVGSLISVPGPSMLIKVHPSHVFHTNHASRVHLHHKASLNMIV